MFVGTRVEPDETVQQAAIHETDEGLASVARAVSVLPNTDARTAYVAAELVTQPTTRARMQSAGDDVAIAY